MAERPNNSDDETNDERAGGPSPSTQAQSLADAISNVLDAIRTARAAVVEIPSDQIGAEMQVIFDRFSELSNAVVNASLANVQNAISGNIQTLYTQWFQLGKATILAQLAKLLIAITKMTPTSTPVDIANAISQIRNMRESGTREHMIDLANAVDSLSTIRPEMAKDTVAAIDVAVAAIRGANNHVEITTAINALRVAIVAIQAAIATSGSVDVAAQLGELQTLFGQLNTAHNIVGTTVAEINRLHGILSTTPATPTSALASAASVAISDQMNTILRVYEQLNGDLQLQLVRQTLASLMQAIMNRVGDLGSDTSAITNTISRLHELYENLSTITTGSGSVTPTLNAIRELYGELSVSAQNAVTMAALLSSIRALYEDMTANTPSSTTATSAAFDELNRLYQALTGTSPINNIADAMQQLYTLRQQLVPARQNLEQIIPTLQTLYSNLRGISNQPQPITNVADAMQQIYNQFIAMSASATVPEQINIMLNALMVLYAGLHGVTTGDSGPVTAVMDEVAASLKRATVDTTSFYITLGGTLLRFDNTPEASTQRRDKGFSSTGDDIKLLESLGLLKPGKKEFNDVFTHLKPMMPQFFEGIRDKCYSPFALITTAQCELSAYVVRTVLDRVHLGLNRRIRAAQKLGADTTSDTRTVSSVESLLSTS